MSSKTSSKLFHLEWWKLQCGGLQAWSKKKQKKRFSLREFIFFSFIHTHVIMDAWSIWAVCYSCNTSESHCRMFKQGFKNVSFVLVLFSMHWYGHAYRNALYAIQNVPELLLGVIVRKIKFIVLLSFARLIKAINRLNCTQALLSIIMLYAVWDVC